MAHEDVGRPLHSASADGRQYSSAPGTRPSPIKGSPDKERRSTSNSRHGDGTEFPRYFLQLGQDNKRSRGYEMIQELQIMVCNKETGIKGNAARARVIVLLREVQGVLVGLENKVDAQTYDLGVFNVERSELRKELRDEKAKEFRPLHTIDFRNTEVKDLPHKLRTLFEDNQVLREQVRQLQYSVRSAESKLEASEHKAATLEAENMALSMALREAGLSHDVGLELRQLRETVRNAEGRIRAAEMQSMSLMEQLELERRMLAQQSRHFTAKQALLEARLRDALGVSRTGGGSGAAAAAAPGGGGGGGSTTSSAYGCGAAGPGRKSSGRAGVYDLGVGGGLAEDGGAGSYGGGGGRGSEPTAGPYYAALSVLDGGGGGGGADGVERRSSAHSRAHSSGPGGGARSSAGRDRSVSPLRSPSGRSISHSPGSGIPTLYPLFNAKPRPTHVFSADSSNWLNHGGSVGGGSGRDHGGSVGGGSYGAGGSIGGGSYGAGGSISGLGGFSPGHMLPPPPHLPRHLSASSERSPKGGSGPLGRPSSGAPQPLDPLQEGRPLSSVSTGTATTSGPGEALRAINSSAIITSRTLLPSVSGASGGAVGGTARSSVASGGGGGVSAGILGLRVCISPAGGGPGTSQPSSDNGFLPSALPGAGGVQAESPGGSSGTVRPDPGRRSGSGQLSAFGAVEEVEEVAVEDGAASDAAETPGAGGRGASS